MGPEYIFNTTKSKEANKTNHHLLEIYLFIICTEDQFFEATYTKKPASPKWVTQGPKVRKTMLQSSKTSLQTILKDLRSDVLTICSSNFPSCYAILRPFLLYCAAMMSDDHVSAHACNAALIELNIPRPFSLWLASQVNFMFWKCDSLKLKARA